MDWDRVPFIELLVFTIVIGLLAFQALGGGVNEARMMQSEQLKPAATAPTQPQGR